jgi:type IV pilus secretin PilQ/predicted competence protein
MIKESKWVLAVAATILLALPVSQADGAVDRAGWDPPASPTHHLIDLDVDSSVPGQVTVDLVVDGEMSYESFVLDSPYRLVLDLTGVENELDQYKFPVGQSGVERVRAAEHAKAPRPVTRVVFDLERPLAYTIERRGSMLVVDFDAAADVAVWEPVRSSDAVESDSLAALIEELESRPMALTDPAPGTTVEPDSGDTTAVVETAAVPESTEQPARIVEPEAIESLMASTEASQPRSLYQESERSQRPAFFKTQTIVTDATVYSGKEISLNLVDADIKQVFRLFHEISGLNFVLDPSVTGRVTIVLDEVPWDQALDLILKNNGLDKVLENNVVRIATTQRLSQEAAARKQLKEAKELEVEPITITRTLSYAKADDVQRVIRDSGVLTNRGKVIVDERTNTLIVSDIPKKVDPLDVLISTLDTETPQVMIEARVVETSRDYAQDLGIVWGFEAKANASTGTQTGLAFPNNASMRYGLNLPGEGGASQLAFKFGNILDSFTLDLALNALETEGFGRVLSSPKIATQNNEQAEIEQGVRIPIVNTTATEINVEFVSASLRMVVTPQITAEGTVILDVEVENNSPDFVNTAGGIPSIRTQRAQTKVLIRDGGTTVIGGIFVVNEGRSEVGVPWFRKIPIFGWLFKQQNITNQNRELLIFITPKIMRLA